jgi:hypothetical protein
VVAHLIAQLPTNYYIVFLDNLFTNVKLLRYIRARGWGVTGICTAKSGILKRFCDIKKEESRKDKIPWGTLFIEPLKDGLINFIAWKDNALVLFMSIVNNGSQVTKKLRKRPLETFTLAKTSRVPFQGQLRALLDIPAFNNSYNHGMGYVDKGNHLKKANTYMRQCRKGEH